MGERLTRFFENHGTIFGVFAGDPILFPFRLRRRNKHLSERADDATPINKSVIPRFKTLFRKKP